MLKRWIIPPEKFIYFLKNMSKFSEHNGILEKLQSSSFVMEW